ncbi:MAG: nitrous oxide reductase accessory protein NosL [Cyclobacteriaceae bacterium]|nr:nitrous oxide reductase accessory protein NosL [Cyclobacteriaceae bacterium]
MKIRFNLSCPLIAAAIISACSVKPEPIQYGSDMCHTCKMTIMDRKFGGEVVTEKGKIYKFDDLNCMINFLNSGYLEEREVAFRLVIDYAQPAKLIDATQAFYLKSNEIRTPMASRLAAFESDKVMEEYKKQWNAIYLTWGEAQTQFK